MKLNAWPIFLMMFIVPSASAGVWASDSTHAYRWNGGTSWDAGIPYGVSLTPAEIIGPDDDLYVVGTNRVMHLQNEAFVDLPSPVSLTGGDPFKSAKYINENEVWLYTGTGKVILWNGASWSLFKTHNPPGCGSLDGHGIDRTDNYLWIALRCSSAPFRTLNHCELPECSSVTTNNFAITTRSPLGVSCVDDAQCFVGSTELYRCGPNTDQCVVVATTPASTKAFDVSTFSPTWGVAGTSSGRMHTWTGGGWPETFAHTFTANLVCSVVAYEQNRAAVCHRRASDNVYFFRHWDGTAWVDMGKPNNFVTMIGGSGRVIVEEEVVEVLEPEEFTSGLARLLARTGFVTEGSKVFFTLLAIGVIEILAAAALGQMGSSRTKNLMIYGAGAAIALFLVFFEFMLVWMMIVSGMLGVFAVTSGSEIRNTWREVQEGLGNVVQRVRGRDPDFSAEDFEAAIDGFTGQGGEP